MKPDSTLRLVLASASPRRFELLRLIGLDPVVIKPSVSEEPRPAEKPADYTRRLARDKACRVAGSLQRPVDAVIAADTIVVLDGRMLGKPADAGQARLMLEALSGRRHEVFTGYCVLSPGSGSVDGVARTEVRFKPLTDEEIADYVDSGEPLDKAGGYGIQGRAAYMVAAIRGSHTNVIGLPLAEVWQALQQLAARRPVFAKD